MLRSLACGSLVLALVAGCTAGPSRESAASSDLANADLGAKTVVKGSIAAGQTVTVDYQPSEYPGTALPYLALAFEAGDAGAAQTVTVGGKFPGTPHLMVVDPSFKVLAEADGIRTADGTGAKATLALPATASASKNLLLVQDPQWAVAMTFDVSAE